MKNTILWYDQNKKKKAKTQIGSELIDGVKVSVAKLDVTSDAIALQNEFDPDIVIGFVYLGVLFNALCEYSSQSRLSFRMGGQNQEKKK